MLLFFFFTALFYLEDSRRVRERERKREREKSARTRERESQVASLNHRRGKLVHFCHVIMVKVIRSVTFEIKL